MAIKLIVAIDENNGIGKGNELLFDCPFDMRNFKKYTENSFVVMGRSTYESLKNPLKNRINVIVSRDENYNIDPHLKNKYEIIQMTSLERVINHYNSGSQDRDLVIIGGESVYKQSLPYVDEVRLTKFHHSREADTFFPLGYVESHFELLHKDEWEIDGLRFDIVTYKRKEIVDEQKK